MPIYFFVSAISNSIPCAQRWSMTRRTIAGAVIGRTEAQAIVLGSYAIGAVYVNLKIVQPVSNAVLAAYDYVLPANTEVRSMLRSTGR